LELTTDRIPREEALHDAVVTGERKLFACATEGALEVAVRDLREDARPVATRRVAAGSAAVRKPAEDLETELDRTLPRPVLQIDDEAEPASVMLVPGVVQARPMRPS
jgi:hypothetical protein